MAQKNRNSVQSVVVETKPRISDRTKKIGYAAILVVVLLAIGLWLWAPWHKESSIAQTVAPQEYTQQVRSVADTGARGKDDEALALADKYLTQPLSDRQKAGFIGQKAVIYERKGDEDKAFSLYKQCERLEGDKPDIGTAQSLMSMYYRRGDKHQAAMYARKLITLAQASQNPLERSQVPGYKKFIQSLGERP